MSELGCQMLVINWTQQALICNANADLTDFDVGDHEVLHAHDPPRNTIGQGNVHHCLQGSPGIQPFVLQPDTCMHMTPGGVTPDAVWAVWAVYMLVYVSSGAATHCQTESKADTFLQIIC